MNRYLRIEKFRNIGIDKEEKLMINSSLKKGEQGNLIILVGENNSGKSNVLDALMRFQSKNMQERDVTIPCICFGRISHLVSQNRDSNGKGCYFT